MKIVTLLFCLLSTLSSWLSAQQYATENGKITFVSQAPMEEIKASSERMRGIITPTDSRFVFSVDITSFTGFNGDLQREHFNENYLESSTYPKATFSGKLIEPVDFSMAQVVEVRAKGTLEVHGVKKERIIPVTLEISNGKVIAKSKFTVNNADHAIEIPKIVNRKVAELVNIEVVATLIRK
jgi:polyisoprenoid-binding protein YceI